MAVDTPLPLLLLLLTAAAILHSGNALIIDPRDLAVLEDLRRSLTNPDALGWGPAAAGTDPCGSPGWAHVACDRSGRVINLDLKDRGLAGTLPASIARLDALQVLSLQRNNLSGPLPSFRGMASLRAAFLSNNAFSTIPADFFDGPGDLEEISLDHNPTINSSTGGWTLPPGIAASTPQLRTLWLSNCSLTGGLPEGLGAITGLQDLRLSYNMLSGPIPVSFSGSGIQTLFLDNQLGHKKLFGTIDVLPGMIHLKMAFLHGNHFSGPIPDDIGACKHLTHLWLNSNELVGLVPSALTALPQLKDVRLDNNYLVGPAPVLKAPGFTFSDNGFCADKPGVACTPDVMALLHFFGELGYPKRLVDTWVGNDPCKDWLGVTCYQGNVTLLNLPRYGFNGTMSSSVGKLWSLSDIRLSDNNLTGHVPTSLTDLKLLKKLDLSNNNLIGPLPAFSQEVNVSVAGNPNFNGTVPAAPPSNRKKKLVLVLAITIPVAVISLVAVASLSVVLLFGNKNGSIQPQEASLVVHSRDNFNSNNMVNIVMENKDNDIHMIEAQNFLIPAHVLQSATNNFSQDNVLGYGGFGVVYKGVMHDNSIIAVKRMKSSVISSKAKREFQTEIAILTKIRHRNLVSILGYSIEGDERMLVYEHMSNGALSKHLFKWKLHGLEPISWKKRLDIALDVARGMEYLHSLAQQCYIHRDLKPANILLGDDFRAKVSDFGLLKTAHPDGNFSTITKIAGTFGYMAPEYAVPGKITTKVDVFSFGVVLMELITGRAAIDESCDEDTRYLTSWFVEITKDEGKFRAAIDPSLVLTKEIFESISVIAELAGQCTSQDPSQRPVMGHAVTVLVSMAEKWKPSKNEAENYMGMDKDPLLLQTARGWQETEGYGTDGSIVSL